MTRVVISERFGGFGLSPAASARLKELGADEYARDLRRDDPRLLQVVDEFGPSEASGGYAKLVVVEIPDDVKWHVHEYDGFETLHEDHRSWGSDGVEENCS